MYEYFSHRNKLMNKYKDLMKKLPKKLMNIHFKSINIKRADARERNFPSQLFKAQNNEEVISLLDPETKSFILNNKNNLNSIFHRYSNSFQKNSIKKKFFNKQTIILTKYNNVEPRNKNNIKINDIIYNIDSNNDKINKIDKYSRSYNGNIYKNNKFINKNNNSKKERIKINKDKILSHSFFDEIKDIQNNKKIELIINGKNKKKDNLEIVYNNNIKYNDDDNNKNCQTSFGSIKSTKKIESEKNNKKSLSLKNEENKFNLNNNEKKPIQNKNYKTYYFNKNNRIINKNMENNSIDELKKREIKKNEDTKKANPLFNNNMILKNLTNNTFYDNKEKQLGLYSENRKEINSYYFNNKKKRNKINLFIMDTGFLKDKGNYLYGNNNNFIGKSMRNYQTKNNIFLPNLTLRLKSKLPRYERQSRGFIIT